MLTLNYCWYLVENTVRIFINQNVAVSSSKITIAPETCPIRCPIRKHKSIAQTAFLLIKKCLFWCPIPSFKVCRYVFEIPVYFIVHVCMFYSSSSQMKIVINRMVATTNSSPIFYSMPLIVYINKALNINICNKLFNSSICSKCFWSLDFLK